MAERTLGPTARLVGVVAVLGVLAGAVGLALSLAASNTLLTASQWAMPALLTLGVVVGSLLLVVLAGGPSRRWLRTPYW